jgi:hypothetical protein
MLSTIFVFFVTAGVTIGILEEIVIPVGSAVAEYSVDAYQWSKSQVVEVFD